MLNYSKIQGAEPGAMTPNCAFLPMNLDSFSTLSYCIIERYAMTSELFVSSGSAVAPLIYPGELALYLYINTCYHISRVGNLTNTNFWTVPDCADLFVPVPLAKWLEGLSSYTEDGCCFSTSFGFTQYGPTPSFPPNVTGSFPRPPVLNIHQVVGSLYPNGTEGGGEFSINLNTALLPGVTWDIFCNTRLQPISALLASSTMLTVRTITIPIRASDGSAYVLPNALLTATPLFWCSPIRNYHNDSALLYNVSRVSPDSSVSFRKPLSLGVETLYGNTVYNLFASFVFLWSRRKFKRGPIIGTTKLCKIVLKTLFPTPLPLGAQTSLFAAAWYRQIRLNINKDGSSALDGNGLIATYVQTVLQMLILHRLNMSSPLFLYDYGSPPQTYFTTYFWSTLVLPAPISQFLSDIGPVVLDDTLYFPIFSPLNGSASPYSSLLSGPKAVTNAGPFVNTMIITDTSPLNAVLLGTPISNTFVTNCLQPGATVGVNIYAIDMWAQVSTFINANQLGETTQAATVHQHNTQCGSVAAMLSSTTTAGIFSSVMLSNLQPVLPSGLQPSLLFVSITTLTYVNSAVQLSYSDLTKVAAYVLIGASTNQQQLHKFSVVCPTFLNPYQIQSSILSETYSPGSSFGKAVAMRQDAVEDFLKVPGMPMKLYKTTADCSFGALLSSAWKVISPFAGAAAVELATTGVKAVGRWVTSLFGAEGNDTPTPNSKASRERDLRIDKKIASANIKSKQQSQRRRPRVIPAPPPPPKRRVPGKKTPPKLLT